MPNSSGGQQTAVPYALIPLLAILGAGAFVLIVWAFARLQSQQPDEYQHFSDAQMNYMREVRRRNQQDIVDLFGYPTQKYARKYSQQWSQRNSRDLESQY